METVGEACSTALRSIQQTTPVVSRRPTWATYSFVEYDRLVGSTAASPIVTAAGGNTNQWTIGIGLTYSFAMGGLPF